ncbi:MAG: hypothetical protein NTW10_07805 [Bacteroidetes bacterium]|nr:hypothetical protein [Bacteroidota bacterium]
MNKILLLFPVFILLNPCCYSQATGSRYFIGKPKFINTAAGKILAVDYPNKTTDASDSVKTYSIYGLIELSSFVNKAINNPSGEYNDFQVLDATKIGVVGYYHLEYTLFYCNVSDALDLCNNKISQSEFVKQIQLLSLPDYIPPTTGKKKKTFMELLQMDNAYYAFPMRMSVIFPFSASMGYSRNLGFEISNVWSRPKSVANFRFQFTFIWLSHDETTYYERCLIPSVNLGLELNFLGDVRFNLKPYVTLGWNPVYYYYKNENDTVANPNNLINGWYLSSATINYGLDLDAWIKKGLGVSIAIEQSRYLAEILPDIYGSSKAIALNYLTFKIGLLF